MTKFLAAVRKALRSLDDGFCKLNRIQYAAPWRTGPTRC